MVLFGTLDSEILDGQGLNHQFAVLALGQEAGYALVDGTAYGETELGIKAILHVGEVLVAHQLYQRGGHLGHTRLDIRLVPHGAACPARFPFAAHVLGNLLHHHVGEHSRIDSRRAVGVCGAVLREVDSQRAHKRVVGPLAGVGMEREGHVDGQVQALAAGEHARTAGQIVHPVAARRVVVLVVVCSVIG